MFNKIAKLALTVTMVLGLTTSIFAPMTLAADPLKEQSFDVTKYLDLGKDDKGNDQQAQSYFTQKGSSPTVAFIVKVLEVAIKIAGTLAVVLLIGTGLAMVLSQGNQNVLEKAKQMFLYEIIGLIVIFTSYVVITFVQSIFTTT